MNDFRTVKPTALQDNVFHSIGSDWMLVTAGTPTDFNTMTASWGGQGVLWNKNVAFAFVRPQRYTFEFMERELYFTLSFFDAAHRSALQYCGSHSGRDVDKMAATGLTPLPTPHGSVAFTQARLVFVCHKLYAQDLAGEHFIVPEVREEVYPTRDFHRLYVGEIMECWIKGA